MATILENSIIVTFDYTYEDISVMRELKTDKVFDIDLVVKKICIEKVIEVYKISYKYNSLLLYEELLKKYSEYYIIKLIKLMYFIYK